MSNMSNKPSSACGCVRWFSQGHPTYRLVCLDMSELILEGKSKYPGMLQSHDFFGLDHICR